MDVGVIDYDGPKDEMEIDGFIHELPEMQERLKKNIAAGIVNCYQDQAQLQMVLAELELLVVISP
jgi:hypothetical protein